MPGLQRGTKTDEDGFRPQKPSRLSIHVSRQIPFPALPGLEETVSTHLDSFGAKASCCRSRAHHLPISTEMRYVNEKDV